MKHLFLLTIPTVQAFIKQARKTQDLYVGSQLLSDLIKAGAKEFHNQGGELIFPAKEAETFTNRFLDKMEGEKTDDELHEIGNNAKIAIQEHLVRIAEQSVKKVIGNKPLPKGFDNQIENLLDIKWAFMEWDGKPETYKDAYLELEKLIGAIKNVRTFEQFHYQENEGEKIYGEQGRKCSIDGERNVKFYRKTEKDKGNDVLRKKLFIDNPEEVCFIDNKVPPKYINAGEGLSAVSFFKRCYIPEKNKDNPDFEFPSTAEIALLHNLQEGFKIKQVAKSIVQFCCHFDIKSKILNKQVYDYLKNNCGSFDFNTKEEFNHQYLYEENFDNIFSETVKLKAKPSFLEMNKVFSKNNIRLSRYYAIIVFDGDSMGKWLSGENLVDKTKLYEFHEALSECLSNFSKKVEDEIPENKGRTVYSGGDDFVGFVNLNYLFPVMEKIYDLFDTEVNQKLKDNPAFQIEENKKLTLSAGVAIAHYKTPLGIVLAKARDMEKLAKKDETKGYKKDAFAIAVLKRSGEINQTVWKWKAATESYTTDIFKGLVSELQNETGISNKFIKNTQIEFSLLVDEKEKLSVESKVFNTEFERLLENSGGKKQSTYDNLKPILPKEKQDDFNLENFFMALNIADFIQRNTNPTENQ